MCEYPSVRSINTSDPNRVEGYLLLWGDSAHRDCYDTYFDRSNPPKLDILLPIPLRYEHGQDPSVGAAMIGQVVSTNEDDRGIRFVAELDNQSPYYDRIRSEIAGGGLGVSTGVPEYLADFDADGKFKTWPIAEVSLTSRPCERRMPSVSGSSRSIYRSAAVQSAITNAPKGDAMQQPPQKAKLTLAALGLSEDSGIEDVVTALKDALGSAAASAVFGQYFDDEPDGEEVAPPTDSGDLSTDEANDEDPDTGASDYDGARDAEQFMDSEDDEEEGDPKDKAAAKQTTFPKGPNMKAVSTKRSAAAEIARLQQANADLRERLLAPPKPAKRAPVRTAYTPPVSNPIYDELGLSGMVFAYRMLTAPGYRNMYVQQHGASPEFQRALAHRFIAARNLSNTNTPGDIIGREVANSSIFPFRNDSDVRNHRFTQGGFPATRAQVDASGNTGFGSDYVGVHYDNELWLIIRAAPIYQSMVAMGMAERVIAQGYGADVIPLEGSDLMFYRVPETLTFDMTGRPVVSIPPTAAGTSSKTLHVQTLGSMALWTRQWDEDSIVSAAGELNRKMAIELPLQVESAILNGDTNVTPSVGNYNINANGSLTLPQNASYTMADGALKYALVAAPAAGNANAATLQSGMTTDMFAQLRKNLDPTGIAGYDTSKLAYILDPNAYLAAVRMPEVRSPGIAGENMATLTNGNLDRLFGIKILMSGQIAPSDTSGMVNATPTSNIYGRALVVRPDQWVVGIKRESSFQWGYDVAAQANMLVVTTRFGLAYRSAASGAAALAYGISV